jgi:hypothetical protein
MTFYERSAKNSHLDTIRYEIGMLGYCYREFAGAKHTEPLRNLLIEGFLLHFRNLVEFFSGARHRPGGNGKPADLSTTCPHVWAGRQLTSTEVEAIQKPARDLENQYFKDISQYLQHCTERRFDEFKGWEIHDMRKAITPIVRAFLEGFCRSDLES